MSEIRFVRGDATRPEGTGPKVLVHVCNDLGRWGKGFVMAISKRWKEPEADFRRWYKNGGEVPFALGEVTFVGVEPDLWVANLIGQHGLKPSGGRPPVRYDDILHGLKTLTAFAKKNAASVHMPRIGCGLAGGDWEVVEALIHVTLIAAGTKVTVYAFGE
jgi:O-acetyl-ADP-ribose deacetylase (regulator of RNase III)